jgi:transposase InsO family protein
MLTKRFSDRAPVQLLSSWLQLPRSTFYYKAHPGQRGMRPSTHTLYHGSLITNEEVVGKIKELISGPYNAYGYQSINDDLRALGYLINHKKTYRLMDFHKLLLGKVIRTSGKRNWVQYRKILADKPLEYLCLDIKYVWVQGEGRWYYLLSIMDVFSRKILHWIFQKSVRKMDVINMFRWLHTVYNLKGVIIRNDNGSQFLANQVRSFLVQLEAKQEFTHVATPEENAYIEAFHSILQRELIDRFEFSSFYEAKQHIEKYMHWYNYERKHRKLGRITPHQKWTTGLSCSTDKQSDQVAGAAVSRPNDSLKNQTQNHSLGTSLDTADSDTYFCLEVEQENQQALHILKNDSVQLIGG